MSEGVIIFLGVLGFALVGLLLFVIFDREGFRAFVRSITVFELGPRGLRIERAVAEAAKAISEKESAPPQHDTLRSQLRRVPRSRAILWVDDRPENNQHEAAAFRSLGLRVDQVTSNEAAERALGARSYDLVISDIGRRENGDATAGLRVPDVLESAGSPGTPLLHYVGRADAGVTSRGDPVTSRPSELFALAQELLARET